jgi:hypothetical protein
MRIGVKHFLICSAIIILAGFVVSYGNLPETEAETQISNNISAKEEIINLYNELIALRQHAVEEGMRLVNLGQGNLPDLMDNQTKLADARIQLAQLQGKKESVVKELQNLVQKMTEMRKLLQLEVGVGQRPQSWIYEIDARILEAKIRLAKAK